MASSPTAIGFPETLSALEIEHFFTLDEQELSTLPIPVGSEAVLMRVMARGRLLR